MLEVAALSVALRQAPGADGRGAERRRAARSSPSSAPTAPARRRCSRRSPGWCGRSRARRIALDGRDLLALEPHQIVEAGIALVPEGRGIFADLTVAGKPRARRLCQTRARRASEDTRSRVLALFPRLARAPAPAGQHHERRRAADGGDRPRADVGARHPAARRAVARPVAARVRASCSRRCRAFAKAASASCWSSRTPSRA